MSSSDKTKSIFTSSNKKSSKLPCILIEEFVSLHENGQHEIREGRDLSNQNDQHIHLILDYRSYTVHPFD